VKLRYTRYYPGGPRDVEFDTKDLLREVEGYLKDENVEMVIDLNQLKSILQSLHFKQPNMLIPENYEKYIQQEFIPTNGGEG